MSLDGPIRQITFHERSGFMAVGHGEEVTILIRRTRCELSHTMVGTRG